MRLPIIEDTTRSLSPVRDPFAEGAEEWYIEENCPVRGLDILPMGPFDSREAADAAIREFTGC